MKVALLQVASRIGEEPDTRRSRVAQLLSDLPDVDLVVLPELWAAGYFDFESYPARAELLTGPTVQLAGDFAKRRGCYVHAGSIIEDGGGGRLFNTAVLVDPQGEVALTYRKIHVFGYRSLEAQLLSPGEDVATCETSRLGTMGTTTCYDLRFPELWRDLVDLGAQLVVVPSAWPAARRDHWRLFTKCRAVEDQVYVIACNSVGRQSGGVELAGNSRVVDPWGTVLFEASDTTEETAVVELDLEVVNRVREEFPVLADRRRKPGTLTGAYQNSVESAGAVR